MDTTKNSQISKKFKAIASGLLAYICSSVATIIIFLVGLMIFNSNAREFFVFYVKTMNLNSANVKISQIENKLVSYDTFERACNFGKYSTTTIRGFNHFMSYDKNTAYISTATHCLHNSELIVTDFEKSGGDIALIKICDINDCNKQLGYAINRSFHEEDSVFVTGYAPRENGWILISGRGDINDERDGRTLTVKLSRDVDLNGLSGAPALNKKNEVVGVVSAGIDLKRYGCYLVISLFK